MSSDLTTQQVATQFGVATSTVHGWRRLAKITGYKVGVGWFYPAQQFIGWKPVDGRVEACKRSGEKRKKANQGV